MQYFIKIIVLVILLICVICIYSARDIVRNKVEKKNENKVVLGMKAVCFTLTIISLVYLYFS